MTEYTSIGKRQTRVDALAKATGQASFCTDVRFPDMLHARILRSPHPHATIVNIDTSRAQKIPGVKAVVTGKEAPEIGTGVFLRDRLYLAKDKVRFMGEGVAAVAAVDEDTAGEALEMIKVEYDLLSAVFDAEEAMKPDPPAIIHPDLFSYHIPPVPVSMIHFEPKLPNVYTHHKFRKGDVEKGFQQADLIIENKFTRGRVHHCTMEPHIAVARVDPDGTLTVWAGVQVVHPVKYSLASNFQLAPSKVRVIVPYLGGGFGGRGGGAIAVPIAAWLSLKTGKPVKCLYSREETFIDGVTELPIIVYIKDGVKQDGTLVAREIKLICNGGAYCGMTAEVSRNAAFGAVGSYWVPNFKLDSFDVATNCLPAGPFRGYGSTPVIWAIESHMNMLAEKLGLDPLEIRLKNLLKEGQEDITGQITHSFGARECLRSVVESLGGKSESSYPWKKGKGYALCNKYSTAWSSSVVLVKVCDDGAIEIRHSAAEMGQGVHTTLAQMAAEEFGIPLDKVRQVYTDTALTPYDYGCVSSRATFHTGNALLLACRDAKRQLFELTASRLDADPANLDVRGGIILVKNHPERNMSIGKLFAYGGYLLKEGEIIGKGQFSGPCYPFDTETGQSQRATTDYCHGAYGIEVGVNVETGEVRVFKAYGAFDMGQPINVTSCEGQMEGGLVMGMGGAIFEEMVMSSKGAIVNPSFVDYKIIRAQDMMPVAETKSALTPVINKEGPFGAKGFSEASILPIAPAIANAIYNAVGIRLKDLPLTKEKMLTALKNWRGAADSK